MTPALEERETVRILFERLMAQQPLLFPQNRQRLDAPMTHGVYVIRNARGSVLHVGRTYRGRKGLYQRLGNHLGGQSSFAPVYLGGCGSRLRRKHTFQYLEVEDARKRALLEYYATAMLCPKHLGLSEGSSILI